MVARSGSGVAWAGTVGNLPPGMQQHVSTSHVSASSKGNCLVMSPTGRSTLHRDGTWLIGFSLTRGVPGSVVDARRWVSEGETPRMQVRTHQIAAVVVVVTGATTTRRVEVEYHASLPGAVGLDGSIASADREASIEAAGAGRRRCCDQPSGDQHGSQSSDDAVLHGFSRRIAPANRLNRGRATDANR